MKKFFMLSLALLVVYTLNAISPIQTKHEKSELQLLNSRLDFIEFTNTVGDFYGINIKTKAGNFTKLRVPGYHKSADYGMPELPEISRLIEIPYGAKARIEIVSYDEETIYLNEEGHHFPLMPAQPSLSKSQDPEDVEFVYNEDFYHSGSVYMPDMVSVEKAGKLRGIQMALVVIRPFEYNTGDNTITIKNNLYVKVHFENGDAISAKANKKQYYSPAFEPVYNKLWNYESPQTKDALSAYPIKYVIVADPSFETALQPLIEWKTKKGFYVIEAYTDNPDVGSTTASIKSYLEGLYTAGTPEDPAPSFVLFVGDVAQIPTFDGNAGSHVSDMPYCEYDGGGDYIPEVYFGRFSATTIAELTPQIDKTLQFEQYTMPNPSYLGESVMVAGVDGSYGNSHANGQINYGTEYYFNAAHGITSNTYLYPESGDNASNILSDISAGAGYVNYTAHCSSDGWADPSFTISDIAGLDNQDMYYVSVGNCCLSNKFDETECYGEALLRAENEGAVAHLGASNNSLWDEDYYWSVGLISDPVENPTFEDTETGAYDGIFHENGEDPYVTTAQMNYVGNLAVESSSSSNKEYYWEIYHVMGDPSLMPYMGVPSTLTVDYLDPQPIGTSSLTVNTEEGAYAAISLDGVLLDAKLADASGIAELTFDAINDVVVCDVVVTKQNRQPYIGTLEIIPNDNDYDVQLSAINAPSSLVFVGDATFQPEVEIRNLGQLELTSASVNYQIDDGTPVHVDWTGSLNTFDSEIVTFPEITLEEGEYNFKAWAVEPNGEADEYPANDTLEKSFRVYGGDVSLLSIDSPEETNCNQTVFNPTITIRNNDINPLTSLTVGYEYGGVSDEIVWTGSLLENETTQVEFPQAIFPEGIDMMTAYIEAPNGGTDMDAGDNSMDMEIRITLGQPIQLDLLTDAYPDEISWHLTVDSTGDVLYSNGPLTGETNHYYDWCLGSGCYTFTIDDSYGDGLAGGYFSDPGYASITNLETSEQYGMIEGDFGDQDSIQFCLDVPMLSVDPDVLDFGDVTAGESAVMSYILTGENLTDTVFITSPANFDVSFSSSAGFNSTLNIPFETESLIDTIYVKFLPDNETAYNDNINNTSSNASAYVNVVGNGVSGIESNTNQFFSIYPNPSNGVVYVESNQLKYIEITDNAGRTLIKQKINDSKTRINMSGYASGIYHLTLTDTDDNAHYAKIQLSK
ncbi:MAG: C25 family cysteine peptidase [Candidatus Delongbacteria bacterium]|nr:C25 family cysteine peptidase [Candidatus Delongbacteria bacterium]